MSQLAQVLTQWRETDPRIGGSGSTPAAVPSADPGQVERAKMAYQEMHGHLPERVLQAVVRCSTGVTASLGPTVAIEYRDGGRVKRLDFGKTMPELAFDEINRTLHLISGGSLLEAKSGAWVSKGVQVSVTSEEVARAIKAYRDTHGGLDPKGLLWAAVVCPRGPLVAIGPVVAVEYLANKGDGVYIYRHVFETEPPILALDLDTNSLHLVLGSYTVTNHGVEDTMVPSEYAIVANPARPPSELGMHPHLHRHAMRQNPDDDAAVNIGVAALTVATGVAGALLLSWGAQKLVQWRGWDGKWVSYLTMGSAVVLGVVIYMKYPVIGTGVALGGVALGLSEAMVNWSQGSSAGLPAPNCSGQLCPGAAVFTPYHPQQMRAQA